MTAASARAFWRFSGTICAARMRPWRRSSAAMGCRSGRRIAMARRTPIFFRQGDADQLFDVAQIGQFLSACDQRDRDAFGAGARGSADTMDIGFGDVGEIEIHHMRDAVDVDEIGRAHV